LFHEPSTFLLFNDEPLPAAQFSIESQLSLSLFELLKNVKKKEIYYVISNYIIDIRKLQRY